MENIKYCKQGRSKIILELCLANTEDNCTREVCAAENEILNMPGTTEAQVCLTQQDDYGTCPENDVLSELFLNEIVVAPLGDTVLASTSANGMQGEDNRVPINLLNTCTMDVIATDFVNECANDMRGLPSTSQVEVELSEAYSDSGSSYAPPSSTTSSSDNDQILKSNRRSNTTNPETSQHKKDIGVQGKSNLGISIHKGKHTIKRKARNSRKRTRNPDTWHKNVNKRKKTAGEEYINYKKVAVPAKRMLSPCGNTCRRKCRDHFPEEIRENIFQDFYKLSLGNQQQFILLHVKESDKNVQRLRRDADTPSRRNFTKRYNFKKNGMTIEVCQKMFLNTLSISLKRVRVVCEKQRVSTLGVCSEDQRGKHGNQKRISEDHVNIIKEHINSFPAFESHYSRSHTKKKYLSPELTVSKMYKLYKESCNKRNIAYQSESFYRKIFGECFNLAFKKPKNDTCAKCDKYEMVINSTNCEKNKRNTIALRDHHVNAAEAAYNEKKDDKIKSKHYNTTMTVSFDLQKCLPTPYLKNGVSFYKRQLWTFNLTLYVITQNSNRAICYIWNESLAKRGGQEIASCLYKFFKENIPDEIETINIYSDCCSGQNRNIFVAVMFLEIIRSYRISNRGIAINHKFLEPGHTHMEADTIHAAIEREKKKTNADIEIPKDWINLIRMIDRSPKLEVVEMVQSDFLNFEHLLKGVYVNRSVNTQKENVNWLKLRIMSYTVEHSDTILYKNSYLPDEHFKSLNLTRKRTSKRFIADHELRPLYNGPIALPIKKVNDLKELMPYIHPNNVIYYSTFVDSLIGSPDIEELTDNEHDDEYDEQT